MKMEFLEAARNLGIVKCDKHFYYNNGSLYLAAAKEAVRAGAWPKEKLERLLQERCWIRKLQRCFAKHGFGKQTRRMVAEYNSSRRG